MAHLERYEAMNAVEDIKNRRALAESARIDAEKKLAESEMERLEMAKRNREQKQKAYIEFKSFVKDTLLQYVIENLMSEAVRVDNMNDHDIRMMHHFSKSFIHENGGAANILFRAKGRTPLIEEIQDAVDSTTAEVIDHTEKDDPASYQVDKQDIVSCINKLSKSDDFQTAKEKIAAKVLAAEDQFVNAHQQDKAAIEEIINSTEEKIAATDADRDMSAETKEAIKTEAVNLSKQRIKKIQTGKNRSVFDEMVMRYSKSVMTSDILREHYQLDESGRIDSSKVISSVRCMYAILETFSTTKIEKIDENYITKMLDEM